MWGRVRETESRDHTFSIQHVGVTSVHTEQYLAERDSIMKYTASVYIKINSQVTSLRKRSNAITRKLYGKARSPGHEVMITMMKVKSQGKHEKRQK